MSPRLSGGAESARRSEAPDRSSEQRIKVRGLRDPSRPSVSSPLQGERIKVRGHLLSVRPVSNNRPHYTRPTTPRPAIISISDTRRHPLVAPSWERSSGPDRSVSIPRLLLGGGAWGHVSQVISLTTSCAAAIPPKKPAHFTPLPRQANRRGPVSCYGNTTRTR